MITEKMPGQVSTLSGALLSISVTFTSGDIIKSLVFGILGTITSYGITRLLKALFEKPPQQQK